MHPPHVIQEDEYLQLSGIQHFAYCPRQWALIHVENQWADDLHTIEGELMHARVHDASQSELRGDVLILRDLRVFSSTLGFSGACDVVEFHRDAQGVTLYGREGSWRPFPVEYKRGKPKSHQADEMQLCAQAICLEEMLCCDISQGALFYGETRKRSQVEFDEVLRNRVKEAAKEMHQYAARGYTPIVRTGKGCKSCSLSDVCLPVIHKKRSVAQWTMKLIREEKEYEEAP